MIKTGSHIKRKAIFFALLIPFMFSCDPTIENSGDRSYYATYKNETDQEIELNLSEIFGKKPDSLKLLPKKKHTFRIYKGKNSGSYRDSEVTIRVLNYDQSTLDSYRICYASENQIHYVNFVDESCVYGMNVQDLKE